MFTAQVLELDKFNFVKQTDELISPSLTSIPGVFVAGAASGPKDIPDSILSAGCAASEVASYLNYLEPELLVSEAFDTSSKVKSYKIAR